MAQSELCSPDSVGPIRDVDARRVCTLNGIALAREEAVSLRKLRDGLNMTIQELESERQKAQLVNKALLVARFTKASCDAFLAMAGALGKAILPGAAGKQADLVEKVYGTVTPLAAAAGTTVAGGRVDWVQTGAATVKKGVSVVTENKGVQILTKSTVAKVELINGAMNHDPKSVVKSAVSYLYDLHTTIGEMAGAKRGAAFAKIAKSAFEYHEQIGKAFDEMLDGSMETEERHLALKTTIVTQAKRLSRTIDELEQFITTCEGELAQSSEPVSSLP